MIELRSPEHLTTVSELIEIARCEIEPEFLSQEPPVEDLAGAPKGGSRS